MGWRIFIFIACVVGILITSFGAIESIKTVSEKFRISDTFIGSVFLSVGTSFPEFVNSIYAGIEDRRSSFPTESVKSFYNITGANIWQILFLSLIIGMIAVYLTIKKKSRKDLNSIVDIFGKDSFFSGKLTGFETFILILIFNFPGFFQYFTAGGFSFCSLFFLVLGIGYTVKTYRSNPYSKKNTEARYFKSYRKPALVLITLSLGLLFGVFSCINFGISGSFEIDPSTSFGVILSFITSSPEFCVLFFLLKQKEYKMAVSGFFGSSLFNLSLPFYSNIISMNNIFGKDLSMGGSSQFHPSKIIIWLILNIVMISMFLCTFNNHKKHQTKIIVFNGLFTLCLYILVSGILATSNF